MLASSHLAAPPSCVSARCPEEYGGMNPLSLAPLLFLFHLPVSCVHLRGAERLHYTLVKQVSALHITGFAFPTHNDS